MNSLDIIKQHIIKTLTLYNLSRKNKSLRAELGKIHSLADKLSENNGWIGVDDELPNPEQEINYLDDNFEPKNFYLIQLNNGLIDTAYYATICNDCEYIDIFISCTVFVKENRYCVQERGFDNYRINEVKFWQPLPQSTKE